MADDPLDQLMSATLAIEGEDAKRQRPALPFAESAAPVSRSASVTQPVPLPPSYAASVGMPTAMPEMLARFAAAGPAAPAPPPRITDEALAGGATASAYAFSNAATAQRDVRPLVPEPSARPRATSARARVDYLWHERAAEQAIFRAPSMKRERPTDELEDEWLTAGDGVEVGAQETAGVRAILTERQPISLEELTKSYEEALDRGGERLFCMVGGELSLSFEPIDALRVTLAMATPFLSDARLKDAYDAAQDARQMSGGIPPAIAASHKDRVDEAMKAVLRGSAPAIESVIERALQEDRAFARRRVFGNSFVRGLLSPAGRPASAHASSTIPVYVPEAGAQELPLMRSAPVRLIVEVRPAQDALESHPLALRVVALGRVVELLGRAR